MRILVLTKCIFREEALERNLRLLGHEVFSSETMVEGPGAFGLVSFFHVIILSDTLFQKEQISIAKAVEPLTIPMLKVSTSRISSSMDLIQGIIPQDCDVEKLRTIIESVVKKQVSVVHETPFFQVPNSKKINDEVKFSNLEKRLLECLHQARGESISSEEICRILWKGELSHSRKSHISFLVNSIRKKLAKLTPEQYKIETDWGNGYSLKKIEGFDYEIDASDRLIYLIK